MPTNYIGNNSKEMSNNLMDRNSSHLEHVIYSLTQEWDHREKCCCSSYEYHCDCQDLSTIMQESCQIFFSMLEISYTSMPRLFKNIYRINEFNLPFKELYVRQETWQDSCYISWQFLVSTSLHYLAKSCKKLCKKSWRKVMSSSN